MTAVDAAREPGMKLYVAIWIGLVAIVGVEVALTYAGLSTGMLLLGLLALAVLEAGLGLLYFMHLKWERPLLFWSVVPALVFAFLMMNHIWRDAARMISLHP